MNISFIKNATKKDLPHFKAGDVVRVSQRVKEGSKERIQTFEGLVISRKHGRGLDGTFTVRRVSQGYGVEKTFPLHLPSLEKIEIVKRAGRAKRSKLYWTRQRTETEIRKKLKFEKVK